LSTSSTPSAGSSSAINALALRFAGLVACCLFVPLVIVAVLLMLVFGLPIWAGPLLAAVIAVVVSWWIALRVRRVGEATVLLLSKATDATAATAEGHARLVNLVDGLCDSSGYERPDLYVVDDGGAANSFVTARSPGSGTIGVTSGLLDSLTRLELEAVVAHQLAQLQRPELVTATAAVGLIGAPVVAVDRHATGVGSGNSSRTPARAEGMMAVLAKPFVPGSLKRLEALIVPGHATEGDLAAVALTRYPPALIAALDKMRTNHRTSAITPATAHLWFMPPSTSRSDSVDQRVAVLQEL
jgi:heat shock protein HtpX